MDIIEAETGGEVVGAKTATEIRRWLNEDVGAKQALYKLSEPLEDYEYVVVSAQDFASMPNKIAMGMEPETYIFGADEFGEILAWGELDGSYRGGLSHIEALEGTGYYVIIQNELSG